MNSGFRGINHPGGVRIDRGGVRLNKVSVRIDRGDVRVRYGLIIRIASLRQGPSS